jgi:hypothetical protein
MPMELLPASLLLNTVPKLQIYYSHIWSQNRRNSKSTCLIPKDGLKRGLQSNTQLSRRLLATTQIITNAKLTIANFIINKFNVEIPTSRGELLIHKLLELWKKLISTLNRITTVSKSMLKFATVANSRSSTLLNLATLLAQPLTGPKTLGNLIWRTIFKFCQ